MLAQCWDHVSNIDPALKHQATIYCVGPIVPSSIHHPSCLSSAPWLPLVTSLLQQHFPITNIGPLLPSTTQGNQRKMVKSAALSKCLSCKNLRGTEILVFNYLEQDVERIYFIGGLMGEMDVTGIRRSERRSGVTRNTWMNA